jgi:hypothetical protein
MHTHLTFSGLGGRLSLWGRQEHCPFAARLRVLKLSDPFHHVDSLLNGNCTNPTPGLLASSCLSQLEFASTVTALTNSSCDSC